MRSAGPDDRRAAFGDLVAGYWKPVYKYLRIQWHVSDDEAQDLTQAFFTDALDKEWLARYEPGKARFRTFVRLCVDRFAMNARQSAERQKRGGATELLSLDFNGAEGELVRSGVTTAPDADDFFRREFVRELFDRAVNAVRSEYIAAGKALHITLFERYDLDPSAATSYASLAREHGLTQAQVTNALAQVRRSFREHALSALRGLCGSDEELRREARELFGLEIE